MTDSVFLTQGHRWVRVRPRVYTPGDRWDWYCDQCKETIIGDFATPLEYPGECDDIIVRAVLES